MPQWIDSPEEEKAWRRAKKIVSKQRGKPEDSFTNRDWGLVTHVAKSILRASFTVPDDIAFTLATVDQMVDRRDKHRRRVHDDMLPQREVVLALKELAHATGEAISSYRNGHGRDADAATLKDIKAVTAAVLKLTKDER